jgi:hypothetical protein
MINTYAHRIRIATFIQIVAAKSLFAQSVSISSYPLKDELLGKWSVIPYFEINWTDSGDLDIATEEVEVEPIMLFNNDGSGKVGTIDPLIAIVWSYDESSGELDIAYVGYESKLYLRKINDSQNLMIEKQYGKTAYVVIMKRN